MRGNQPGLHLRRRHQHFPRCAARLLVRRAGIEGDLRVDAGTSTGKEGDVSFGRSSTYASAAFTTTTASPYTCTTTTLTAANCTWTHCTGNLAGTPTATADSAGVITISGGPKIVALTPAADNTYAQFFDPAPAWNGGETLTIAAAGATVPAFSSTFAAPMPLTLTSPTHDAGSFTIDRTTPLALAWTGGTVGQLYVTIAGPEPTGATVIDNVTCSFAAAAGSGSVPGRGALEAVRRQPGRCGLDGGRRQEDHHRRSVCRHAPDVHVRRGLSRRASDHDPIAPAAASTAIASSGVRATSGIALTFGAEKHAIENAGRHLGRTAP